MAVTFTPTVLRVRALGDLKEVTYNVACSGTMTDNGDTLLLSTLGILQCEAAECTPAVDNPVTGAWIVYYDIPNQKVVFLGSNGAAPAALAEPAAATAVGTRTFRMKIHGKGPVVGPAM